MLIISDQRIRTKRNWISVTDKSLLLDMMTTFFSLVKN